VVEEHILSTSQSYNIQINGGIYDKCDLIGVKLNNSTILNSLLYNSNIDYSKIINSQIKKSIVKDSTHISDNIIKILAYDEWNLSEYRYINSLNYKPSSSGTYSILKINNGFISTSNFTNPSVTHKMYKFYISEKDYRRLKYGYNFYIKGLKNLNNPNDLSNFFEKRYKLGTWHDFIEGYTNDQFYNKFTIDTTFYKQGFQHTAFLSTPSDNKYILNSNYTYGTFSFIKEVNNTTISSVIISSDKYWTGVTKENPNSNE
jgi:hypothetical protein